MSTEPSHDFVMLPLATRDFILKALRDASGALSRTHRLRATSHILLTDGVRLTQDNSFQIDHLDQVLLMNLVQRLLAGAERGGTIEPRPA